MTADTITAIKKALMELPLMKVEFSESSSEGNSIISPTDDFEDAYFTVIGCGDKQDDLGRLIALAVNSMPGLLSTLESLQRENEELRKGKDHIAAEKAGIAKNAHSNVDYWKSQYEAAEAEVKRYREALHIISAGHACPIALANNALRPAALSAQVQDVAGWRPIETAPKDKTPIIIAVPTKDRDDWIVGEGYFDPDHYEGGDWWWANLGYGDYHAGPISECNHWPPELWQPLPVPAAAPAKQES